MPRLCRNADSFTWWAAALLLAAAACHPAPKPKLFAGGPLPIGEDVFLQPANYSWAFPAQPGETFRVLADWAPGKLRLKVGSDRRGSERDDDDDASNPDQSPSLPSGAHGQTAIFKIGPKANTATIELHIDGFGTDPIRLRIDRGP